MGYHCQARTSAGVRETCALYLLCYAFTGEGMTMLPLPLPLMAVFYDDHNVYSPSPASRTQTVRGSNQPVI